MNPRIQGPEISLTLKPLPGDGIMETFGRLAVALKELEATIVHLMVFGSVDAAAAGREAMRRLFGRVDWPVTWVEGAPCDDCALAGIQVLAVAGAAVHRIIQNGRIVGSLFDDGVARQCVLGGLGPDQNGPQLARQTARTLENIEKALAQVQFSYGDIVRTWFYLEDILSWYPEFNRVRTQTYSGVRFRSGSLPASTGVGARNVAGAAVMAAVRAIQPANGAVRVEGIVSPLQCAATVYGSAFSRAMEIDSLSGRRLFVSGTASIAPGGQTLWSGDPARQIGRTVDVVESILQSRGMNFSDISRAVAYFKHRGAAELFTDHCVARGWHSLPVVNVQGDICRDDLLFELEVDAWGAAERAGAQALDFAI